MQSRLKTTITTTITTKTKIVWAIFGHKNIINTLLNWYFAIKLHRYDASARGIVARSEETQKQHKNI